MKALKHVREHIIKKKKKNKKKKFDVALEKLFVMDAQGVSKEKPPIINNPVFREIVSLDIDKLRRVLDAGASPTKPNPEGQTPLYFALQLFERGISSSKHNDAVNIVELLLQRGADPNCLDKKGKSPLFAVISYWNRFVNHANAEIAQKLAQLLTTHGARVKYQGNKPSLDPFRLAVKKHNAKAVQFFIDNKYEFDQVQAKLPGPTIWPPVLGYEVFVDLAKNNVFDIEATDWCGLTALHRALQMTDGYDKLVGIVHLLDLGANVNALDCAGRSILLKAAEKHYLEVDTYTDLLRLIVLAGADVVRDCRNHEWAPIRYVLQFGNWAVLSLMLNKIADSNLDLEDLCRYNPLYLAALNKNVEVLEELLQRGYFHLEQKNDLGDTPLQAALICIKDDAKLAARVELFLQWGARVNTVNGYGWTPLHAACSSGLYECVKILLSHGADINIRTQVHELPLEMAMRCSDSRIPQLLISHVALRINGQDPKISENIPIFFWNPKMRDFYLRCLTEIEWSRSHILLNPITFYHLLTQKGLTRSFCIGGMLNSLSDNSWRNNYMIYDTLIDDRLKEMKFVQAASARDGL